MIDGIPYVTENLVEALEKMYPARCLKANETVEQHLRYAGKVELIALLRANCLAAPKALLDINPDDDALIDEMVEHEASRQQENS